MAAYARYFKIGWALYWRSILWGLAFGIPSVLFMAVVVNNLFPPGHQRDLAYRIGLVLVCTQLSAFHVLPRTLRGALQARYRGFSIRIRRGGAVGSYSLSYREELQASGLLTALSLAVVGMGLLLDSNFPTLGLFSDTQSAAQFLVGVFLLNPLLALALLHVPYRGFRFEVEMPARPAEGPAHASAVA